MEEDIKNMSKEELLEYLEEISQQLDNIALDQIQFAISELQFFKEEYKKLVEENKKLIEANDNLKATKRIKTYKQIEKNFIPTSVIQEKLNKDKKEFDKMKKEKPSKIKELIINQKYARIMAFKELLEEGKK